MCLLNHTAQSAHNLETEEKTLTTIPRKKDNLSFRNLAILNLYSEFIEKLHWQIDKGRMLPDILIMLLGNHDSPLI